MWLYPSFPEFSVGGRRLIVDGGICFEPRSVGYFGHLLRVLFGLLALQAYCKSVDRVSINY